MRVKKFIYLFFSGRPVVTEIWSLDVNDDAVNMKIAEPQLAGYGPYPVLFLVDSNFCIKK